MAVDPRAVSVFVVATEEAEVHGALANEQVGSRVVSVFVVAITVEQVDGTVHLASRNCVGFVEI